MVSEYHQQHNTIMSPETGYKKRESLWTSESKVTARVSFFFKIAMPRCILISSWVNILSEIKPFRSNFSPLSLVILFIFCMKCSNDVGTVTVLFLEPTVIYQAAWKPLICQGIVRNRNVFTSGYSPNHMNPQRTYLMTISVLFLLPQYVRYTSYKWHVLFF